MQTRLLGATGLTVSELGLGAGPLGDSSLDDAAADHLIRSAIDLGVTLIDTAPSYGRSEARIGVALRGLRARVLLSTKLGYGVPGIPDWTGPCITAGVDQALARLGTAWLDIAHLHSCPREVLERGDVIEALEAAVRAGKVRVPGYSGDGDALAWAIDSGRFGVVQCSVNLADQRALDAAIPRANHRGVAVLAKRPLANTAWRHAERPEAHDRGIYWERLRAMGLPPTGADPAEYALRFVFAQPIAAALVGTTSLGHLRAALAAAARGPLGDDDATAAREAFRRNDRGWDGVI
jgi:aryl-alcohol dehydrogenase-like predicted oxidoreductase